jgi:hypothetical protein
MLARIKDRIALERENRDLRRRLQGGRAGAAPAAGAPTYGAPSTTLRSAVLPTATAPAAPVSTYTPPAAAAPAAGQAPELANRVGTMEERLARMEELLRAAVSGR